MLSSDKYRHILISHHHSRSLNKDSIAGDTFPKSPTKCCLPLNLHSTISVSVSKCLILCFVEDDIYKPFIYLLSSFDELANVQFIFASLHHPE